MESSVEPRFLSCLFKPRKSCCFEFFTLKSAIAFGCFFDIGVGILRLISLIFHGERHYVRTFQGVTAPLIAVSAVLCLIGLSREKIGFVKGYWIAKAFDAVIASVATYLLFIRYCSDHDCKTWLFLVLGCIRIGLCMMLSQLAWSASYYFESGHKLLVFHGPQVLELMEHQASSMTFSPVTIVEGQAIPSINVGARINS